MAWTGRAAERCLIAAAALAAGRGDRRGLSLRHAATREPAHAGRGRHPPARLSSAASLIARAGVCGTKLGPDGEPGLQRHWVASPTCTTCPTPGRPACCRRAGSSRAGLSGAAAHAVHRRSCAADRGAVIVRPVHRAAFTSPGERVRAARPRRSHAARRRPAPAPSGRASAGRCRTGAQAPMAAVQCSVQGKGQPKLVRLQRQAHGGRETRPGALQPAGRLAGSDATCPGTRLICASVRAEARDVGVGAVRALAQSSGEVVGVAATKMERSPAQARTWPNQAASPTATRTDEPAPSAARRSNRSGRKLQLGVLRPLQDQGPRGPPRAPSRLIVDRDLVRRQHAHESCRSTWTAAGS